MELSFSALGVELGGRTVLDGVTATLQPGRITAILGPNGAGKSTLLKVAAGLIAPSSGSAKLADCDVGAVEAKERARTIGYLPQDHAVHWNVVARDVVALGRLPHCTGPSEDFAAIAEAMVQTDTSHLADRPILELSGGERARVLLARVLAGRPRWLLADEPLASLDPAHQIDLLDRLHSAAAGGMGIAVVLHDLAQAARAADDVLLLDEGRVAAFGPTATVLVPDTIARVFGVEVAMIDDGSGRPLPVPVGRARR